MPRKIAVVTGICVIAFILGRLAAGIMHHGRTPLTGKPRIHVSPIDEIPLPHSAIELYRIPKKIRRDGELVMYGSNEMSPFEVKRFYEQRMNEAGWTRMPEIEKHLNEASGNGMLFFRSGNAECIISIRPWGTGTSWVVMKRHTILGGGT